jgi:hypothetical protein
MLLKLTPKLERNCCSSMVAAALERSGVEKEKDLGAGRRITCFI